jgi:hypothetical protein
MMDRSELLFQCKFRQFGNPTAHNLIDFHGAALVFVESIGLKVFSVGSDKLKLAKCPADFLRVLLIIVFFVDLFLLLNKIPLNFPLEKGYFFLDGSNDKSLAVVFDGFEKVDPAAIVLNLS